MKEPIVKINKTKSWFFEKINKIDKPLARLIKEKRENQKWKRRGYNRQCRDIRSIRDYYEQLYGNKMDNLKEMDRFLKVQSYKTETGRNRKFEQPNYKH